MSFDDDWGHVVEGTGEFARPEKLAGHLVIVFPLGYVPHIQTRFSMQGKKSDAITCDVVDLDELDEIGNPGKMYRSSNLMQSQLIVSLRPFIGTKVLGRIGKGVAKNGMNAPWIITDMSADPESVARARQWAATYPDFVKSPFQLPVEPVAVPPQQPQYADRGYYENQYAYGQQAPAHQGPPTAPPQAVPGTPPPAMVQAPASPQQPSPAAVVSNAPPTAAELDMLQQMRLQRAQREAQQRDQFGDNPPF